MKHEEILARQESERKFLATPVGLAFHKFKHAYFTMAADEYKDHVSDVTLKKHADAVDAAETKFRAELAKLMGGRVA
jgi:hypothetical protein